MRAKQLNGESATTPAITSSKAKGTGKATPKPAHTHIVWRMAATTLAAFTRDAGKARVQIVPTMLAERLQIVLDCYADSIENPSAYRDHTIGIGNGQSAGVRAVLFLRIGVPALQSDGAARKIIANRA